MTPVQKNILTLLKDGARLERDSYPPNCWFLMPEKIAPATQLRHRSIEALIRDGHVKMEPIPGVSWADFGLALRARFAKTREGSDA